VSGVRRVVVGVSGSPGGLQALRYAADLARVHDAALVPVLTWLPPGGDLAERRYPSRALRQIWQDAAWQRLWNAIELAFGGVPGDLAARSKVLRGEPARVLADIASQPGDVLVVGAGRRGPARPLACRISRYCLAHARCPVLAVPPPALARFSHGPRGWVFRHRELKPELAGLRAD
jgi:nucleotide-binding universal stress UspA family protein